MTPESEFKKFLIIILAMIAFYIIVTSDCGSSFIKKNQYKVFNKIFEDKEITLDIPEQDSENWFYKTFKKKNRVQSRPDFAGVSLEYDWLG